MADLARKLTIRPGQTLCLIDLPAAVAAKLRQEAPPGITFVTEAEAASLLCDLIFFAPHRLDGLSARLTSLESRITLSGAIWVVTPKKRFAASRGITFTWEEMQAAALTTDLVDNKIASLTDEDYATRFVIRKDRRHIYEDTSSVT
ncbi:MAG TPA: hypothetical protein VF510_18740 [Ktedonobacterales bacterium]